MCSHHLCWGIFQISAPLLELLHYNSAKETEYRRWTFRLNSLICKNFRMHFRTDVYIFGSCSFWYILLWRAWFVEILFWMSRTFQFLLNQSIMWHIKLMCSWNSVIGINCSYVRMFPAYACCLHRLNWETLVRHCHSRCEPYI